MTNNDQATTAAVNGESQKAIRVQAHPDALFDALTTVSGLAAWWTDVAGHGGTGGELSFSFDPPEPLVVRVDQATRPLSVRSSVISCDFLADWVGTHPTFTNVPVGDDGSELQFRHHGLTQELECIEQCTRGWDHFLESLRQYAETGHGMPRGSSAERARRIRERA